MGAKPQTIPLERALQLAEQLKTDLQGVTTQVVPSGSVRRGLSLMGDVDLIAVGELSAVAGALAPYGAAPDGERPWILSGEVDGIGFDIAVVQPASFGAAQAIVTGPATYRTFLEEHAFSLGMNLTSAGVRELTTGALLPTPTEDALFALLGLPLLPPAERGQAKSRP